MMSEPTDEGVNGTPTPRRRTPKPALGLLPKGEAAPTPPPPFGSQERVEVAPDSTPRRRNRTPAGGPALTMYHLPPKYRQLAPPGLEGIALANHIFAMQSGEELARQEVEDLAGLVAVQQETLEQLQAVFRQLELLGAGMVELLEALRSGGLPATPAADCRSHPTPAGPGDRYDSRARRQARAATTPAEPQEPAPPARVGPPGKPAPLLNADAERITTYLRGLVPIAGIPWAADAQIALVEEIAEELLAKWSEEGATVPSRWQQYVEAELIARLGIDRAKGDPE